MRRPGSASRPYGRYAVGLRPSLDSDPYPTLPNNRRRTAKNNDQDPRDRLTRPRPFRDDLRFRVWAIQDLNL